MAEPSSKPPFTTEAPPIPTIIPISSSHSTEHNLLPTAMILDNNSVTFTPYAGEYFNIWKFQVQCIFCSRNLLNIVEGRELLDATGSFATRQYWLQRDQQAMDILVQTMDQKYLPLLLGVCFSCQMWIHLLLHYDKRATTSVHGLQKKFFDLKPTVGKGIQNFLFEVNNVNN
jgi:hypothetical protein